MIYIEIYIKKVQRRASRIAVDQRRQEMAYEERCKILKGKGQGTRYLTLEVPLLSREYSPRKPTVCSFYPPLSISAPF